MFIDTLRLCHRCGCVNRYAALASPLLLRLRYATLASRCCLLVMWHVLCGASVCVCVGVAVSTARDQRFAGICHPQQFYADRVPRAYIYIYIYTYIIKTARMHARMHVSTHACMRAYTTSYSTHAKHAHATYSHVSHISDPYRHIYIYIYI